MQKYLFLCLLFITHILFGKTSDPLLNKISSTNCRYDTMRYALQLMDERKVRTIVETGTARGGIDWCREDGCSTIIWAEWVKNNHAMLYSVDIDPAAIKTAKRELIHSQGIQNNVILTCSDSISFLRFFGKQIDFLYLDSFDYDFTNPLPSQEHHLKEIIAAYPWLTRQSIVMIDDCDLPGGGKGTLAISYLLNKGWKIAMQGYQVIMIQE
jgi:predicted O-methyltransferase YrrM